MVGGAVGADNDEWLLLNCSPSHSLEPVGSKGTHYVVAKSKR